MDPFTAFGPELFEFLDDLSNNNDRDWFKANQARYEEHVREPARAFIRAVAPHLGKVSRQFVASDRKVGGSLMRPQRDTRFAKDKSPYKTNVGIQFRHKSGSDVHAPGLYVHLDTEQAFIGAGMWRPDADALRAVRRRIVTKPGAWATARDDRAFRRRFELSGEALKRPPRGFPADHVHADDLRRTDHIAVAEIDVEDVLGRNVVRHVVDHFVAARPYVRFLTQALALPF